MKKEGRQEIGLESLLFWVVYVQNSWKNPFYSQET